MKEYDVKITETLEKTVTVQAESHDAAEEQVRAYGYKFGVHSGLRKTLPVLRSARPRNGRFRKNRQIP